MDIPGRSMNFRGIAHGVSTAATNVAERIGRVEVRILGAARALVTVVFSLGLVGGALVLINALLDVSASPDVTIDGGDVELAEFEEPAYRNVEAPARQVDEDGSREAEQAPESQAEGERHVFQEELDAMVNLVRPLYDGVDFQVTRRQIENYLVGRIDTLQTITESHSTESGVQEERLNEAVAGMSEYMEDLVDYYGGEIDLDEATGKARTPIVQSFREHVHDMLSGPVDPYLEEYEAANARLLEDALNAEAIAAQRNKDGAEQFLLLGVIGLVMLGAVLLLLVFKVEQSLRQQAEYMAQR